MTDPTRPPERPGFRPVEDASEGAVRHDGGEPRSFDPYELRPDPFGTGPRVPSRRPEPEPMRTGTVSVASAADSPRRDGRSERARSAPPPGGGRKKGVPIWAAALGGLALAALLFAAVTANRDRSPAIRDDGAGAPAIEVVDRPREADPSPAPPEVRPPDAEAVRRAYDAAGATYREQGVPGLVRQARACFEGLGSDPSWERLDYCLAYDAIGAALQQRLDGGAPPPADSWFGQVRPRGVEAVRRLSPDEPDPAARVSDIRRVLGEVGRLRRAEAQARVAEATPPPPAVEPAVPPVAVPAPGRPGQSEPAPAARPPVETRRAPPPAVAEARPEPRRSAPAPVAEREPERSFSPSFNCRYARTRAERIVCAEPRLSAADRALNRAYEAAIARGADRRELRDEQDQWLRVRERAAPDPGAIEDAYRRRIRELEARGRPRERGLDAWF